MGRTRPTRNGAPPLFLPPNVFDALGPEVPALLEALAQEPPVSIRLHPLKAALKYGDPVPWCQHGRYLPERPVFTLDPLLHAGAYYVQEASSMLLEQAFRRAGIGDRAVLALDLCAAPGGKSTHLAALLSQRSLLVSNEPVPARQPALQENLWKQGYPNVVVTGAAPAAFLEVPHTGFDLVLVDAPCSGEGMFRKEPYARAQWSERLVVGCARTQAGILGTAWELLAPGGHLIYSTCTWETAENEEQVERLINAGATVIPMATDPRWGVVEGPLGCRCYPHRLRGEGLFMTVLRKDGHTPDRTTDPAQLNGPSDTDGWIGTSVPVRTQEVEDVRFAVPSQWAAWLEELRRRVPVLSSGTPVAERKGLAWRPHPALALSTVLNASAFPAWEVGREEALSYLRGATDLPGAPPPGPATPHLMLRHQGLGLGWMHAAGARWNNGWPKPWRIRMR